MDYLITLDEVKERMGLNPGNVAQDEALYSGMRAAHLRVEAEMETVFAEASYTDQFYLDPSYNGVVPNKMFRLKLRNGFLRSTPDVSVGSAWNTDVGDLEALDSTLFKTDLQRGIVQVPESYQKQYVTISYGAGFDAGESVPEWLKEALLGYIPLLLNFSSLSNNNAEAETTTQLNVQHVMSVLAPYRRNIGLCMLPI